MSEDDKSHKLRRDERVVERNSVLYKDSNMWDSSSKRKRVKFEKKNTGILIQLFLIN